MKEKITRTKTINDCNKSTEQYFDNQKDKIKNYPL